MSTQSPVKTTARTIGDAKDALDILETLAYSLRAANKLLASTTAEAEHSSNEREREANPHLDSHIMRLYGLGELYEYIAEKMQEGVDSYYGKQ